MECGAFKAGRNAVLFKFTSAELSKILGGLRDDIGKQLDDDATNVLKMNLFT